MRNAVFVDSGGWIALLSRRDGHHPEANATFRAAVKRRTAFVTSNLVLAEVHRLLLFRAGRDIALAAIDRIASVERVSLEHVTPAHHEAALDWLRRFHDQAFTYTDATSFALMSAVGSRRFVGFDRHFETAGFERMRAD